MPRAPLRGFSLSSKLSPFIFRGERLCLTPKQWKQFNWLRNFEHELRKTKATTPTFKMQIPSN